MAVLLFPVLAIGVGLFIKKRRLSFLEDRNEAVPRTALVRIILVGVVLTGIFSLLSLRLLFSAIRENRSDFPMFGISINVAAAIVVLILFVVLLLGLFIVGKSRNKSRI